MRVLAIILVIIVAAIVLAIIGWSRVPDILANNLSKKLQVAVSIESMDLSLSSVDVNNLEIGNPRGYSLAKAFSAKEIQVHAPLREYLSDSITIDEIDVNDIYLGLEFDSAQSAQGNWSRIMSSYKNATESDDDPKNDTKILIKRLVFNNIQSDLLFRKNGGKVRRLPLIRQIVLTNVSTEGDFPMDQLMSSILGQMLREVFIQQNLNNQLQGIIKAPGKAVDTITKPFKDLFNTAPKKEENKVA